MAAAPSRPESTPEPPFLDGVPPRWAALGLSWVLLVVFAAVAVASLVITLPDVVTSPFVLVPGQGGDPIRAVRGGVIAAVRVRAGQPVERGTPAFVIRSSVMGDRSAELESLEAQLSGVEEGRRNSRQRFDGQRRADAEEERRLGLQVAHLQRKVDEQRGLQQVRTARFGRDLEIQGNENEIVQREIEIKRSQQAVAQELADRMAPLRREGTISWLEYTNRRLEAGKLAVEVQQLERTLETGRLKLNQLRAEQDTWEIDSKLAVAGMESESREIQARLAQLRQLAAARDAEQRETDRRLTEDGARARIRAVALRDELNQTRAGELTVPVPCTGTILRLQVNAPGAVVQDGEILAEAACGGERLHAEVAVAPSGVGRIQPGQRVRLLYDAFPYQRHGVKYGTVRWVSPASITVKDERIFRVLADVEEPSVRVGRETRPLMAG
ncbi:MAG TPA: HlyD family efflux transporter periplasmic adaptor subunit, partial [Candidatus Limnocylindrales bacterium]|nr:HlyD family efflux transporter periplasmic adaptor subunit [Candidatus Limnocylindrales bacterium]